MPTENATALVLRVVEFSETSTIVTLFTREFGKVRGLAKGARRPKSAFESALDLLCRCRIVFVRKSTDALELLTEARLERRFRAPGRDLSPLYAAYYLAELLGELTDDQDPHPELFDAAIAALDALGVERPAVAHVVLWFELNALRLLGQLPQWDQCADCGKELAASPRVAFGIVSGGVLCTHCRPGKRQVVSLSRAALDTLRTFAAPETLLAESRGAGEPPPAASGEVRGLMNRYLAGVLGRRPRLHKYLGLLTP